MPSRSTRRIAALTLFSSLVMLLLVSFSTDADAQRRRRRRRQQQEQAEPEAPMSEGVAALLSDIEWGWSQREFLDHYGQKLRREYGRRMAKSHDAIEEDRLIAERNQRIRQISESLLEFDGTRTGYDAGFLRDEFTHRNQELMYRVRSEQGDDFFFFIHGDLWKWYRAFDSSVFGDIGFDEFAAALENRLGPGLRRNGELYPGAGQRQWVEWQDADTRVRAIDNTPFYGFFCIVLESKATLARIDELRVHRREARDQGHSIVDAVVNDDPNAAQDEHENIVDHLTKKRR